MILLLLTRKSLYSKRISLIWW